MGAVYAAVDEALERPVAVKLIRDDLVASVDLTERFRREARAAAAFTHLHVVRVYDFGLDREGRAFLVMELLEGQTLRQRLGTGEPLPPDEVLHVLRGVCPAVSAAHAQGLVHRDLKPENIFLQRHEAGVVPEGARLRPGQGVRPTVGRGVDARARAPGCWSARSSTWLPSRWPATLSRPAWDIWALGVIAYEMLTRSHPFRRRVSFGGSDAARSIRSRWSRCPRTRTSRSRPPPSSVARSPRERELRPHDALTFLRDLELVLR